MKLSEAFLLGSMAVAGCEPGSVALSSPDMGRPYAVDTAADTGMDTDTQTDTATGTDSGADTDTDTGVIATQEEITTSVEYCMGLSGYHDHVDLSMFTPSSDNPTLDGDGTFRMDLQPGLNPDVPVAPDGVFPSVFACAQLGESDLGMTATRDLRSQAVALELDVGDVSDAGRSLSVWVGTQNADGSFRGFTYPSADNPHTARNFTLVGTEVLQ